MSDEDREKKKEYTRNYQLKRKNLLNYLFNPLEELEDVESQHIKCFL